MQNRMSRMSKHFLFLTVLFALACEKHPDAGNGTAGSHALAIEWSEPQQVVGSGGGYPFAAVGGIGVKRRQPQ